MEVSMRNVFMVIAMTFFLAMGTYGLVRGEFQEIWLNGSTL